MSSLAPSHQTYIVTTLVTAATAAVAASMSLTFGLPIWAMFVGWIAFFTRIIAARTALENLGCVGAGMIIGALAALAIGQAATVVGPLVAIPMVIFLVALTVVALRGLPVMNNLLGYFLGLVAWFAADLEPAVHAVAHLFGASMVGGFAGWLSHTLPGRLFSRALPA